MTTLKTTTTGQEVEGRHPGPLPRGNDDGMSPTTMMTTFIFYKKTPRMMVIELLHFCVMWMNSSSVKSGISKKWSPWELVSHHRLDTKLHCRAPFGSYCEMHLDPDITNMLEPKTN